MKKVMQKEVFKPISVKSPRTGGAAFAIRLFVDLQLRTIVDFLKVELATLPAGSVIDIGAGESPWKDWLPLRTTYNGIDIGSYADFGMNRSSDEIVLYDGAEMPLNSDCFDSALCIEVLEHAKDPDLLMKEIHRILKPGGILLLTVPWSARRHHIPNDFHRFTKERLEALLFDKGFFEIEVRERGNDYCVIANKALIIFIRNCTFLSLKNLIYRIPLAVLFGVGSFLFILIALLSLRVKSDVNEDPLGYACKAKKR